MNSSLGYCSLENEIHIDSLKIEGQIPNWIAGSLLRNGPAHFEVGNKKLDWLDGLAMIHAFHIKEGRVSYTNKFLQSDYFREVREHKKMPYRTFASDPCRTIFKSLFSFFYSLKDLKLLSQNANVNLTKIANHFVAMTEVPLSVEFDPETLDTLGVFRYEDSLAQNLRFETAHPHEDGFKKEMWNYYLNFSSNPSYTLFSVPYETKTRKKVASYPVKKPSYMHSFAITQRFVILVEFPFRLRPISLFLKRKPFIYNYRWLPEMGTKILIFDRESGNLVSEHETDPFFAFHHVNAFEKDNQVFIDLIAYKEPSFIFAKDMLYSPKRRLIRLQCNLSSKKATILELCPFSFEMPKIHYEKYNGNFYEWVYGTGPIGEIAKVNTLTGKVYLWKQQGCFAGEPIFIAEPQAEKEDAGIILSVVLNTDAKHSFLVVLDAKNFQEMGRASIPHPIPFGLHGKFFKKNKYS